MVDNEWSRDIFNRVTELKKELCSKTAVRQGKYSHHEALKYVGLLDAFLQSLWCDMHSNVSHLSDPVIEKITDLHEDYKREHPIDCCRAEHMEHDDWVAYDNDRIRYITRKLKETKLD